MTQIGRIIGLLAFLALSQPAFAQKIDYIKLQDTWENVCWKHSLAVKQGSKYSGFDAGFEDCAQVLKAWQAHAADIVSAQQAIPPTPPATVMDDAGDKVSLAAMVEGLVGD